MSGHEDVVITADEIRNALESLDKDELASKKRLAAFSDKWPAVVDEIESVSERFGALNSFRENLSQIRTRIHDSSVLAEDISSKVRQLDKIRGRVSECQKRVQDLLDLQLCSEGVQVAMKNDQLEQAAAHVHRYLSIDQAKLRRTADDMAQDCSMITSALQRLRDATRLLQDTVSERFERASSAGDCASAERYFKIFPLLGMHGEGLEKYVDHLGRALKASADENAKIVAAQSSSASVVTFADGLTFVFEEVAKTIEARQPTIETHYGPDYVLRFLTLLQERYCDEFGHGLLRTFLVTRDVEGLLKTVRDADCGAAAAAADGAAAAKPDARDVDLLVEEVVLILARYDLYARFVRKRVAGDSESAKAAEARCASMLDNSRLCRAVQELMGKYLELERYYMEESIRKAVAMDAAAADEEEAAAAADDSSSLVDDVYFIVRKCVMRSLRSGSLDVLCAVINYAVNALEADMCAFFERALSAGYPGAPGYFNRFAPDAADKARRAFVASLNNTEVAVEYTKSLSAAFREEIPPKLQQRGGGDAVRDKLDGCLQDFGRVIASLVAANRTGFRQLHASLVEPKAAAWTEPFYEQCYEMDESEFARAEADNRFVRQLVLNVDAVFREFRAKLAPNNYDALVVAVAAECAAQLERAVTKTAFNRLGGMALDKVVRTLISYFGGASAWPVRERFARLVQVTAVLNLERVSDLNEFLSPESGVRFTWKLTPDAIRQILKLRTDFREDEIRQIKL